MVDHPWNKVYWYGSLNLLLSSSYLNAKCQTVGSLPWQTIALVCTKVKVDMGWNSLRLRLSLSLSFLFWWMSPFLNWTWMYWAMCCRLSHKRNWPKISSASTSYSMQPFTIQTHGIMFDYHRGNCSNVNRIKYSPISPKLHGAISQDLHLWITNKN